MNLLNRLIFSIGSIVIILGLSAESTGQSLRRNSHYTIGRKDAIDIETIEQFENRILTAASQGPNFATSFAVVAWSCGFVCVDSAIVSLKEKTIYHTPFSIIQCKGSGDEPLKPLIEIAHMSKVITVNGRLEWTNGLDDVCGRYEFRWNGKTLTRIWR